MEAITISPVVVAKLRDGVRSLEQKVRRMRAANKRMRQALHQARKSRDMWRKRAVASGSWVARRPKRSAT